MTDEKLLEDARDSFALCEEAESENRLAALDDLRFAKLGEQWPESVKQQRIKDGRPCLTINRQPAFIRQVVNEARQNRPSIQVHPVDSVADPAIAQIYNGLIRNIEQTSKADVAYDTAVDCAVSNGFGYFRINTDYADDDSFELDLRVERIVNPFSVYGDPLSTACDSADWNQCFVTEVLGHDAFRAKYKGAEPVNWETSGYDKLPSPWAQDKCVLVAEWWRRERVKRSIVALSDGTVLEAELCVAGAPLAATGLSDGWQGATMMWDAVHGRSSQGTNYLKDLAQTASPKWGGFVYDTVPLVAGAGGLYARVPAIVDPAVTGINTTRSLFGVTVPQINRATSILGHVFHSNTTKALFGASMAKKAYDAYQDYPAD